MNYDVKFLGSFPSVSKIPGSKLPQYAFVGRSNVGKSSLINMLTGRKSLAKVSKQPGKTQMINLFSVDDQWMLVDLPGYGYAKQSIKKRKSWDIMVKTYLRESTQLQLVFSLIDSNIPLQNNDLDFVNWMGTNQIPFAIVYTKTDREKKHRLKKNIKRIREGLLEYWEFLPQQFQVSSVTREGREPLLQYIAELNQNVSPE